MKLVILAGGLGTRLSEETAIRPKPMVDIGGYPILWHIMKMYAAHGVRDFIVCCGYKGEVIKEYFSSYVLSHSDVTFDLRKGELVYHNRRVEDWRVTLVDTGAETMTGGRLRRVRDHLSPDEPFCFTYGDGLATVNIADEIEFHRGHGGKGTMVVAKPPGRFGAIVMHEGETQIRAFHEKPKGDGAYVNAGFFILNPSVVDYIEGDSTVWEQEPLERLAREGSLHAYRHEGFWQPMDTLRDKKYLEDLWKSGKAPWKVW